MMECTSQERADRPGFTLLEVVPALSLAVLLLTIVIVALNPAKQYANARDAERANEVGLLADAIARYTQAEGKFILNQIPTAQAIEICGDTFTGSCSGLLDLGVFIGTYLDEIPTDPLVEDSTDADPIKEHSRYFVIRKGERITVSAPDAEYRENVHADR